MTALQEVTLSELLDELRRRSVGCVALAVVIGEGGKDEWHYSIKGSSPLVCALVGSLYGEVGRVVMEKSQ